jgi:putative oxidoreductase
MMDHDSLVARLRQALTHITDLDILSIPDSGILVIEVVVMQPLGRQPDSAFWVVRFGVALIFVLIGLDKFGAPAHNDWIAIFARIGLGQWFRVATGCTEIAGGLLLLARATSRVGAVVLGLTMLGAAVAHVTVLGDPLIALVPLALGAIGVATGLHEPAYDVRGFVLRSKHSTAHQHDAR